MKATRITTAALLAAAVILPAACSDSGTTSPSTSGSGTMVVRLTDAPFLSDSVKSVDVYVVRVDARAADTDSATADHALREDSSSAGGWKTVASPNASYNLLALQNGVSAVLGQATLAAGSYSGFRLVIDPAKSSVTLKGGQVLTGTSNPGVTFPSAAQSGIKIVLTQPVSVVANTTTNLLVDFDVENSFVMRGNSIQRNGLLFKPVIKATVTNTATTNATVRLANATNNALNLLQNGTALTGGSNLAFGTSSACSSVSASNPLLTVVQAGSTTPLTGFSPTLAVGTSYNIVAYPTATGGVAFSTMTNTYTPTAGQTGFRVFNATTATTGYDVYVTAAGGALTTATATNVAAGATSAVVSVPAGSQQIRVTTTGGTTVVFDLGTQTLTAGQNVTLVIAPPAAGTTTPRAFLVTGC